MANLALNVLYNGTAAQKGLQALAASAAQTSTNLGKIGSVGTSALKRLAGSSAHAARAGNTIGSGLQRGIMRPMAGLPGIIAGLVGGSIVMGAKRLATEASDMNETVSKTRTIFGTSSKAIESWARGAAKNLGMSRLEALNGASAFGNLFDQLGFGAGQATKMSKGFVQMATDAASFNNANPAEVMDAFLAATRGEYDALQKYIPTASAATIEAEAMRMTHKKSARDLTAADKAAALYRVSIKGLGQATGDFDRTSAGFANQQRIMAANWADLRVKIGQHFLPMFTKAAVYMNTEGFPALTRIVGVLGQVGKSAGRMGRAVLSVFSGEFATAIDGATTNLTEIADWMETNQVRMVKFFIRLGHGAIDFGRTLVALAANGIRAFGKMAGGLADFIDGAIPAIQGVMEGLAEIIWIFDKDAAKAIREASVKLGEGGKKASQGLRETKTRAEEAASSVEKRFNPVLTAAERKLDAVGRAEIWRAKQREAAARAAIAIRDIGTNADGSQVKLKKWSDITKLGADRQKQLRDRISAARTALKDKLSVMAENGAGQAKLTRAWEKGRDALYREFRQMGLSKAEAKRLAAQYAGIPPKAETKVTQPGMKKARDDTRDLDNRVNALNSKSIAIKVKYNATGSIRIAKSGSTTGGVTLSASGGVLPGWSPGRDIHEFVNPRTGHRLHLSGGEAVMRPEWTKAVGGAKAVARMNMAARQGQAFANGGIFRDIIARTSSNKPPNVSREYALAAQTAANVGEGLARSVAKDLASAEVKRQKAALAAATTGPGGSVGVRSVPRGWGAIYAAARKHGARNFGTYPGHHPSMARARDITPHNWKIANALRALSSVWYVIYKMRIASKNHGNGWRQYTPIRRTGDYRHDRHIHVARYDQGGMLKPGLTLAVNGTGRPERVIPLSGRGSGGGNVYVTINAPSYVGPPKDLMAALPEVLVKLNRANKLQMIKSR